MLRTRGTTLVPGKVDELFFLTYNRIDQSFDATLQNTIDTLQQKIADINKINQNCERPNYFGQTGM